MSITISVAALALFAISAVFFILATALCWQQGLFEGDSYGISGLFVVLLYGVLWAIPSLVAWAVWATWFQGVGT